MTSRSVSSSTRRAARSRSSTWWARLAAQVVLDRPFQQALPPEVTRQGDALLAAQEDRASRDCDHVREHPGEAGGHPAGGRPGAQEASRLQLPRAKGEELLRVEVAAVRGRRPQRVGFDDVVELGARSQGVAAVLEHDAHPRVVQELTQLRYVGVAQEASQELGLHRRELEDRDRAGLLTAAGRPRGVSGAEPDDRDVPGRGMDEGGHGAQVAVHASEGNPAVSLSPEHDVPATDPAGDEGRDTGGVLVDVGRAVGRTVKARPQGGAIGHEDGEREKDRGQGAEDPTTARPQAQESEAQTHGHEQAQGPRGAEPAQAQKADPEAAQDAPGEVRGLEQPGFLPARPWVVLDGAMEDGKGGAHQDRRWSEERCGQEEVEVREPGEVPRARQHESPRRLPPERDEGPEQRSSRGEWPRGGPRSPPRRRGAGIGTGGRRRAGA